MNPTAFSNLFAVPSILVDEHIRMAGAAQLKCLLCLLRWGGGRSVDEIAETLHLPRADVVDALQYWVQAGLLTCNEPVAAVIEPPVPTAAPVRSPMRTAKPSKEDVVRRGMESKEIAFLLNEAQLRLGRLLSHNESATLVWLHDNEGLSVPVLLMVIEYAVNEEQPNFKFIEKTAVDWASRGVETIEQAEERIAQLALTKTARYIVMSAFGLNKRNPSQRESSYSVKWVNEFGYTKQMLQLAYDQCVDNTGKVSFPYINKILENWHKNGVHSKEQLEGFLAKNAKKESGRKSVSYDLNDYETMIERQAVEQAKQLEGEE